MSQKCVHKGCGKLFSDPEEPCSYHPGPPVFHEGHKGWKCCKPRVLTFDEFMTIPPCTTGTHSTIDDTPTPTPDPNTTNEAVEAKIAAQTPPQPSPSPAIARVPMASAPPRPNPSPAPPEEEDDDPTATPPANSPCKRKSCGARYTASTPRSDAETCVHHPGAALFHEGSKGWTCCKKRVLEFDEFMRIPGCTTKARHLFIGGSGGGKAGSGQGAAAEERLADVRNDFYQTATSVIASLYLKKIDAARSSVEFRDAETLALDLRTGDGKRYATTMTLFGPIDVEKSAFKIMGTKLELTLVKADASGWPVLRADDPHTGEIIQAGRAGRV